MRKHLKQAQDTGYTHFGTLIRDMLKEKKVIVVLPAYNASRTLEKTYRALPHDIVDEVILVDDFSSDETSAVAARLGIRNVIRHDRNLGYGGNQKTCYRAALAREADIVIMVHPDYQYDPRLCTAMASLIAEGVYECVLGSRILGVGALRGGMPVYKYIANRILTLVQNLMLPAKLSEYHTGYRAFSRNILEELPLDANSNDFVFDNQMLVQIISRGYTIGEISCPTRYDEESSSIQPLQAAVYGVGIISTSLEYILNRYGVISTPRFSR